MLELVSFTGNACKVIGNGHLSSQEWELVSASHSAIQDFLLSDIAESHCVESVNINFTTRTIHFFLPNSRTMVGLLEFCAPAELYAEIGKIIIDSPNLYIC